VRPGAPATPAEYHPPTKREDETMTDSWIAPNGVQVRFSLAQLYADARHRVLHSRPLRPYHDIILSDGYADSEEHLRWVATGSVAEIESWAQTIARDSGN
jgi:hypothetical protein